MSEIELTGFGGRSVRINTGLFINNEFRPATGDAQLEVENPTTGARLASVSAAQKEDVDAAVAAAQTAFKGPWRAVQPAQRGRLLNKLADLIDRDADDLASLEALDAGIIFGDAKALHITQAAETLRYFAGWADKLTGQLLSIPQGYAFTRREPLGVCAAVVPWNAPLMITIWKLAPAIAAGNVLIIKTPELSPLYGQKLAELVREAGFPAGVVNILCGEGRIAGQALAEHHGVKKIAFTGSGPVGREIMRAAASSNLKKVTLELGGKGPSIVFGDADLDNALFWTVTGITANNGQVCAAGSRIYVHASIYDKFLAAFAERLNNTARAPGDPLAEGTTKGPVISRRQKEKIAEYIQDAKASGIRVVAGGGDVNSATEGHFVGTTAFGDVPDDARIMKEEIFGPVASIAKFQTEAEVIEKANATEYGLAAAVFTNDVNRAQRVSEAIESGQVTVNCWGILHANTPFGGVKQSGFGRDMGEEALDGWLTTKTVKYFTLPTADAE
ncbi:putative aldehyde dehydrogenase [Apodospora peruviana]|uniref:aldehyde dehydrogenase (NAD(+)) n=1 Tax=Apodospora peruviana TaxID=516989 RepID=A0AAE0ICU2_9PEZI|nr:putative aldehyde dehydrogenase [Apodospora peruviana]